MQIANFRRAIKTSVWTHDRVVRMLELHNTNPRVMPVDIAAILNAEFGIAVSRQSVREKLQYMGARANVAASIWTGAAVDRLEELYFDHAAPSHRIMASTLSSEFGSEFTRNGVISACRRNGFKGRAADSVRSVQGNAPRKPRESKPRQRYDAGSRRMLTIFDAVDAPVLRAVELEPRAPQLLLMDLECHDCRYPIPVKGDALPHYFCGHPQEPGSSYCGHHRALTTGRGTASERSIGRMRDVA